MINEDIIKNFIEILNDKNRTYATAQELNNNYECGNEFLQDLEILKIYGLIKISKSLTKNPNVRLTFEGVYYGRDYLDNYDEIYEKVIDLIRTSSFKTTAEFSKYLGINQVLCGAIFIDLAKQGLINYEQGIGGLKLNIL